MLRGIKPLFIILMSWGDFTCVVLIIVSLSRSQLGMLEDIKLMFMVLFDLLQEKRVNY